MIFNRHFSSLGTLIGLAIASLAGCASPQDQVRDIDDQADKALEQMCSVLDSAKALRFRVHAIMDRPVDTGQLAQFHRSSDITMVRPDRLHAKTESDDGKWSVWQRGDNLTVLDWETYNYATETVPARVDGMLDYMADNYDVLMPMADFLVGKTYESLLADVESGTYVGLHMVGETKCHHLLFLQDNIDWQIWIDAGERPLPRKLVITYTQEPDQPQYVATMDSWDLAPVTSEETFTFLPPTGATSVSMSDLVGEE